MKRLGCDDFFKDTWNITDIVTIVFSILVICLHFVRMLAVFDLTKKIGKTRGNEFTPIDRYQSIYQFYC